MKPTSPAKERALKIELLRARAALERQSMARSVQNLGVAFTPRGLLRSVFPRASSKSPSDWIFQALTLTRRYPLLASSVSAVLGGVGKRRRWWRIGAGLLLSWQVARMSRKDD
ncbi:hypothetical protein [Pollutimonas sp. M17]|uniref:hypothetical protein n=1 Tax=Pollutimonas sp. M17 TaxID=2962065 RepID=UPI0021F4DDCD|nr:hypothetical protein [Pollutimonas sp. M17]UYO92950.1 hypothetical protein OEG81_13775 [Pollutimonas sp. M17]HWK72623.1 hypothetical protein [Burkholderiaceae bacterium]